MKRTIGATAALAAALLAASCGSPVGTKSTASGPSATGATSTLTLTVVKPNYAALAAQAKAGKTAAPALPNWRTTSSAAVKAMTRARSAGHGVSAAPKAAAASSARVVDPSSIAVALYLVPKGVSVPSGAGDLFLAPYEVGGAPARLTPYADASSDGVTPDTGSATFTVNSGSYQWAHLEIYDSNGNLLTQGDSFAGVLDPAGNTWSGTIQSGRANLPIVGFPVTVTTLTPASGIENYLPGGTTAYYSFSPDPKVSAYQFIIWSNDQSNDAFLVLYDATGIKGSGTYYADAFDVSWFNFLPATYSSTVGPYLAVYSDNDPSVTVDYDVAAIPQYPADGMTVSGTSDGSGFGNWVCFSVVPGDTYLIQTQGPVDFEYMDNPADYAMTNASGSTLYAAPTGATTLYFNIYYDGPSDIGISAARHLTASSPLPLGSGAMTYSISVTPQQQQPSSGTATGSPSTVNLGVQ